MSDLPLRPGDTGPRVLRRDRRQLGRARARHRRGRRVRTRRVFDDRLGRPVRAFQQARGLTPTASSARRPPGPWTPPAGGSATASCGTSRATCMPGDDVAALQDRLLELGVRRGRVDGVFGPDTERGAARAPARRRAARRRHLRPAHAAGAAPARPHGRRRRRRGAARARPGPVQPAPAWSGKVVVIDPGHGGSDPGTRGARAAPRPTSAYDLARRLEGRLAATGVPPS